MKYEKPSQFSHCIEMIIIIITIVAHRYAIKIAKLPYAKCKSNTQHRITIWSM